MNLTLEIPQLALDKMPIGYQKRLAERSILQIYEDGYIFQDEFSQICQKEFYQFTSLVTQKAITTELSQNRKKYFSEMKGGTGEWEDILQNIVSSRIDKEPPIWGSK